MEITMEQVRTAIENATKYRADAVIIKLTSKGKHPYFPEKRFAIVYDAFGGEPQATVAELTLRVANSPWAQKRLKTGKKGTVSKFICEVPHNKAVGGFVRHKYGKLITR